MSLATAAQISPQTQTNILSFTFKPLLVYLHKWGPCSRRCNKSTTVYMMSFDTIRSHSNYEGMTLLVTTWTNVFRDQRQPDSSNWVMTSHPPSLLLMNEGLCRLLHADHRRPVCYPPRVERKKKKEENETFSFFYPPGLRTDQMDFSVPPSEGERQQCFCTHVTHPMKLWYD